MIYLCFPATLMALIKVGCTFLLNNNFLKSPFLDFGFPPPANSGHFSVTSFLWNHTLDLSIYKCCFVENIDIHMLFTFVWSSFPIIEALFYWVSTRPELVFMKPLNCPLLWRIHLLSFFKVSCFPPLALPSHVFS